MKRPIVVPSLLALALLMGVPAVHAQQEPEMPEVISPLRVETDHNGVNIVSGRIPMRMPVLAVPGAPNLRFDWVQNAAPYVNGNHSGGESAQASFSVHTITGTSESFRCFNFDCTSVTGSGSTISPNGNVYHRGGSGERYQFDQKQVKTTGNPYTTRYYASSVAYLNGEVITFTYETATLPGQPIQPVFHRPTQVTSNLGYFITISYHPGDLESGYWGSPAEAAIYKSSAPTTPLGRMSYSPGAAPSRITARLPRRPMAACTCARAARRRSARVSRGHPAGSSCRMRPRPRSRSRREKKKHRTKVSTRWSARSRRTRSSGTTSIRAWTTAVRSAATCTTA